MNDFSPEEHRYDFVYLYDVRDGNPNGDPDADNQPRIDPETMQGLITDVCLKRKVRNFVHAKRKDTTGFDVYVQDGAVLNDLSDEVAATVAAKHTDATSGESKKKKGAEKRDMTTANRDAMCARFYDIRTFGAVLNTGADASKGGQVRGPIQLTFGRSEDPITILEHSITRCAVTKKEDEHKERTMGRKHTVPYALYRTHGFVTPSFAHVTKFSGDDLGLFFEALGNMFEIDRSAARGLMSAQGLYVFEHTSPLGNAPAHRLFKSIDITRRDDDPPRDFGAYVVKAPPPGPLADFPGVTLHVLPV